MPFQAPEMAMVAIFLAYLLGAIPFGLLISKWLSGKDPREHGSGNIGATNALRTGGKKVGVLTLLADISKGAVAVGLVVAWQDDQLLVAAVAVAVFLGHIFPVYLKFKGGKGVATMFGVLLPWLPWVAVSAFVFWLLVFKLTRYVSLASVVAGVLLPALAWGLGLLEVSSSNMIAVAVSAILGFFMVMRHMENIHRLIAGEEPKAGA